MNQVLFLKVLLAVAQLIDRLLEISVESKDAEVRAQLHDAIVDARKARTRDEKIQAAKRIESLFGGVPQEITPPGPDHT